MPIEIINLPTAKPASNNEGALARTAAENSRSEKAPNNSEIPTQTDTVSITEIATQLQSMESKISDIPVIDIERVEAVKASLENGEFQINDNKLADNILRIESQL